MVKTQFKNLTIAQLLRKILGCRRIAMIKIFFYLNLLRIFFENITIFYLVLLEFELKKVFV